mgnify:CR=1 FL=1
MYSVVVILVLGSTLLLCGALYAQPSSSEETLAHCQARALIQSHRAEQAEVLATQLLQQRNQLQGELIKERTEKVQIKGVPATTPPEKDPQ